MLGAAAAVSMQWGFAAVLLLAAELYALAAILLITLSRRGVVLE